MHTKFNNAFKKISMSLLEARLVLTRWQMCETVACSKSQPSIKIDSNTRSISVKMAFSFGLRRLFQNIAVVAKPLGLQSIDIQQFLFLFLFMCSLIS